MRYLILMLFGGLITLSSACYSVDNHVDADEFWSDFRQAVADSEYETIADMTRFPFKTRGVHDAMPVITYDEEAFVEVFPLILQTEVPRQLEEGSMPLKQSIIEKETLSSDDFSSENQLWIGDFKFDQTDDGWQLSFIYWSKDQLEK